jgi:calcium-dependent protein kinase
VYKATQTGEIRSIKLIEKLNIEEESEGNLFNEINILKKMDHPNIMKIYEFSSDDKLFDEIIKRKFMNEQDAAYITRQVLSAITYFHSKGVVHRDLKPENILIDSISSDGHINIKVIDFGAALFISPKTRISETLGTLYYIAPEVLKGDYNEKCDLWSIGVILFILLSGSAPFNGTTDDDIMEAVKKGKYAFKSKV